ncbi:ribosomal protein S18-alanine N-acetyltransferase [Holzapfeliella sp. He02]|uniref:Ribosomal protein S18-alanine N-acetyltransferase n=1 Tax=Holzapfeliella saturejae TaxID=3082953 RepID=A0ABU8SFK0_9LACO
MMVISMLKRFRTILGFSQLFFSLPIHEQPLYLKLQDDTFKLIKADLMHLDDLMAAQYQIYQSSPWDKFAFRQELLNTHRRLYLALFCQNKLVGYIGVKFTPAFREAHITNVGIIPEYQNRHLGQHLIQLVCDYAKQLNLNKVNLEVRIDNEKAQYIYQKMGFNKVRIRKNYYYLEKIDGVTMVKPL